MKHVIIEKNIASSAQFAYERIADFKAFEKHCHSVIAIDVNKISATESESTWRVHFHDGEMCWREQDVFNPSQRTIEFVQLEGDVEEFSGRWEVIEIDNDNAMIRFSAHFCMGIPTLADILEPIAESAIRENINGILEQLFAEEKECVLV